VVAAITERRPHDVRYWVRHVAAPRFRLGERTGEALARKRVVAIESHARLGLFRVTRYPVTDGYARQALVDLARAALRSAGEPPPRLASLLALAEACDRTGDVLDREDFDRDERRQAKRRLAAIARAVPVARDVARDVDTTRRLRADVKGQIQAQAQAEVMAHVLHATTSAIVHSGHHHAGGYAGGGHGDHGGH
jgi:hypothetical protein